MATATGTHYELGLKTFDYPEDNDLRAIVDEDIKQFIKTSTTVYYCVFQKEYTTPMLLKVFYTKKEANEWLNEMRESNGFAARYAYCKKRSGVLALMLLFEKLVCKEFDD